MTSEVIRSRSTSDLVSIANSFSLSLLLGESEQLAVKAFLVMCDEVNNSWYMLVVIDYAFSPSDINLEITVGSLDIIW